MNEADTCRKYVVPKLIEAGWDNAPHSFTEQRTFTDGRIIPLGNKIRRGKQKRADYLLRYTRDFSIAIVEAKADYKSPSAGLQQAKEYAEVLGRVLRIRPTATALSSLTSPPVSNRLSSTFPHRKSFGRACRRTKG